MALMIDENSPMLLEVRKRVVRDIGERWALRSYSWLRVRGAWSGTNPGEHVFNLPIGALVLSLVHVGPGQPQLVETSHGFREIGGGGDWRDVEGEVRDFLASYNFDHVELLGPTDVAEAIGALSDVDHALALDLLMAETARTNPAVAVAWREAGLLDVCRRTRADDYAYIDVPPAPSLPPPRPQPESARERRERERAAEKVRFDAVEARKTRQFLVAQGRSADG